MNELSRRSAIASSIVGSSYVWSDNAAHAARGAAELDLEYYWKDLIGGNKREGTVSASPAPPLPPPRKLQDPIASLLLNRACNVDCLAILALVETIRITQPPGRGPGEDPRLLEREIENRIKEIRDRSKASFYQRAPWKDETIYDQYYFDLTSYSVWKVAASYLPESKARDKFLRRLGSFVYGNLRQYRYLKEQTTNSTNLVQSMDGIKEILDLFTRDGVCKGYRLGERPIQTKKGSFEVPAFLDEIDDEALENGSSVDCLISIFEPATLGASLQITGEQSRFAPDFVGCTIAAYYHSLGIFCTWETYFVDPEYRPNPKGGMCSRGLPLFC